MTDKPLTDAEMEAALCRIDNLANNSKAYCIADPDFIDRIRGDLHALVAEVRRLRALLPCPECKCNVAMHALTCSKGGRTGE